MDSLILLVTIGVTSSAVVAALALWRGILSGNLRKSVIWKRPLLLPSIVFTMSIIIAAFYAPLPMSAYHGTNQIHRTTPYSGTYRVYEPGVYEASVQVRVTTGLLPNERLEVFVNFSQAGTEIDSLFMSLTENDLDMNQGATRSVSITPGLYDVAINCTYYLDDAPQDNEWVSFLINQPVESIFIREITDWSTFRFFLGFGCFFLLLSGICVGGDKGRQRHRYGEKEDVRPIWRID
ncbi:MAG: hypothetical protein ACFFE2_12835 [Candidatus Thorarchaeota archaeon]